MIVKSLIFLLAFGLVTLISSTLSFPSSEATSSDEHTAWIAKSLKEIGNVKPGMTRDDLLKMFKEEGGISTRTWQHYVYHDCPYIKVDVEFEPVGETENKMLRSPKDTITKISKPYLEWSIVD